jgi:hypothetical protein
MAAQKHRPIFATFGVIAGVTAVGAVALMTDVFGKPEVRSSSFLRDGTAGFVVTHFRYALGKDSVVSGDCPAGMSKNVLEIFAETPGGERQAGESDEAYAARLKTGSEIYSRTDDGKSFCTSPELAPIDTYYRTLGANTWKEGIDIDGKQGVDNQFYRAVGCNKSFQSDGQSNAFETEMYTGSWGILIELGDVDDLANDSNVKVGIYANADPMQLSPTRQALSFATYAKSQKDTYRAESNGRIRGGVLSSDPVDITLVNVVNGMHLKRVLRDARIVGTVSKDGVIKGVLAGYAPVVAQYDLQFGYRNGTDFNGQLANPKLRLGTAHGAAQVLGHTCQGAWQALHGLADGHPDPKTGRFTSISTQYIFEAAPAFIVDVDTRSVNETGNANGK